MNVGTLKALENLSDRLSGGGFSFQYEDYVTLKDALPEVLDVFHRQASQLAVEADAGMCLCTYDEGDCQYRDNKGMCNCKEHRLTKCWPTRKEYGEGNPPFHA